MEDTELRLQRKNERITTLVDEHSQIQGSSLAPVQLVPPHPQYSYDDSLDDFSEGSISPRSRSMLPDYVIKQDQNRVLRVMVTPIQKLMARHTKTSLLRLKTTPTKDGQKDGAVVVKKKEKENSFFRRRFRRDKEEKVKEVKEEKVKVTKKRISLGSKLRRKSGQGAGCKQKYNLRTRLKF